MTLDENRIEELLELMEAADEDKLIEINQELNILTESYETSWLARELTS